MLPEKLDFRLDAIHAQKDTKVDFDRSQKSFEILHPRTLGGNFYPIPNLDHELQEQTNLKMFELVKTGRALLDQ